MTDVRLEPGWLLRDVKKACARLEQWSGPRMTDPKRIERDARLLCEAYVRDAMPDGGEDAIAARVKGMMARAMAGIDCNDDDWPCFAPDARAACRAAFERGE